MQRVRPIPASYWVQPGQLLAGEYPGAKDETEARQKLRAFLRAGVRFFLDLTQEGELVPYARLLDEEAAALGYQATHRRMPIVDGGIPTVQEMVRILDTLDQALCDEPVVYVHCWGGVGRTATVVGCHLVRHGMDGAAALEEIAHLRAGKPKSERPAPEWEQQRDMVRTWTR